MTFENKKLSMYLSILSLYFIFVGGMAFYIKSHLDPRTVENDSLILIASIGVPSILIFINMRIHNLKKGPLT